MATTDNFAREVLRPRDVTAYYKQKRECIRSEMDAEDIDYVLNVFINEKWEMYQHAEPYTRAAKA